MLLFSLCLVAIGRKYEGSAAGTVVFAVAVELVVATLLRRLVVFARLRLAELELTPRQSVHGDVD